MKWMNGSRQPQPCLQWIAAIRIVWIILIDFRAGILPGLKTAKTLKAVITRCVRANRWANNMHISMRIHVWGDSANHTLCLEHERERELKYLYWVWLSGCLDWLLRWVLFLSLRVDDERRATYRAFNFIHFKFCLLVNMQTKNRDNSDFASNFILDENIRPARTNCQTGAYPS